jgi:tRNA modification GTPase
MIEVSTEVSRIASTFEAGRLLREGLKVALVGRPNVGKSSLFNALLGNERAIVTDIAGTTRDQIHEKLTVNNIPISLIDTAGLRDTTDAVESIGVERSRRTMADADVVIAMLDASEAFTTEDIHILGSIGETEHIIAVNKIDKVNSSQLSQFLNALESYNGKGRMVAVSAKTGEGLTELTQRMIEPFSVEETQTSGFLVSDARHFDLLNRASREVEQSLSLLDQNTSEEIVLIGLHNALRYLGQITGETTTEDMLTRIFSTFCIGK